MSFHAIVETFVKVVSILEMAILGDPGGSKSGQSEVNRAEIIAAKVSFQ